MAMAGRSDILRLLLFAATIAVSDLYKPAVPKTVGEPWPMPQVYQPSGDIQMLSQYSFRFNVVGETCDILEAAVDRYFKYIFYPDQVRQFRQQHRPDTNLRFLPSDRRMSVLWKREVKSEIPVLASLTVLLMQPCEKLPHLDMNEQCRYTEC